jgi:hypothetical protein
VRTVKTASGARAVQIVHSFHRGSRDIEHIGSAHDDAELELLKAVARQRLAAGQEELDLGLERTEPARRGAGGGPLPITSTRMGHLWDALSRGYDELGFGRVTGGDEVFRQLVLARIIEPVSKLDSLRVLEETGIVPVSYATLRRRLPAFAKEPWRRKLSAACAAHARLGPASLVLYDVSTLYFETGEGDGFREPGFSKERRLEPQITIGLLTDAAGFPLTVHAFEGNMAETKTMLPVIESFMTAHQLPDITVVADAGHDLGGQPEGDRGRRAVVHPRGAHPRCSLHGRPVAPRAPRPGHPRRAHLHPAMACRAIRRAAGSGHLLPVPPRPGPPHPARDR